MFVAFVAQRAHQVSHTLDRLPKRSRLARTLRREGKVYLFDAGEVEEPGARFENLVALHLLKLVDTWNDLGYGDFSLHYVRDKEKREVDFIVVNRRKAYLLLEAKLADANPSPALRYFAERLKPKHAVQLTRTGVPRTFGALRVVPAERLLSLI